MKNWLNILQSSLAFIIVLAYCLNLYFALTLQGPYWNMWVIATTAAVGAALPVWLVWHLTEKASEKKEREKFKNAVMLEYSIAFSNLVKTFGSYINLDWTIQDSILANVLIPTYDKHNLLILTSLSDFYKQQKFDPKDDDIVSTVLMVIYETQILQEHQGTIEKHKKPYFTSGEKEETLKHMKICLNEVEDILIKQGQVLHCIALYIKQTYGIDLLQSLESSGAFKLYKKRYPIYCKKYGYTSKGENNVSTEKLSK